LDTFHGEFLAVPVVDGSISKRIVEFGGDLAGWPYSLLATAPFSG
jgi:hypothetical protein